MGNVLSPEQIEEIKEIRDFLGRFSYNINRDRQGVYICNYAYDDYFRTAHHVHHACILGLEDWILGQLGVHWRQAKDLEKLMTVLSLEEWQKANLRKATNYLQTLRDYAKQVKS